MTDLAKRVEDEFVRFYEERVLPATCTSCGRASIVWNGTGRRTASVLRGSVIVYVPDLPLARFVCSCGKHGRLYPPGVVPYRHYQLCVVADAVVEALFDAGSSQAATARRVGCAPRSISRWLSWLAGIASPSDIQARLAEVVDGPILARSPDVAERWRDLVDTTRHQIVVRAGSVLALIEALGHAMRLAPPGLRSVVELLVAGRAGHTTLERPSIPELAQSRMAGRSAMLGV